MHTLKNVVINTLIFCSSFIISCGAAELFLRHTNWWYFKQFEDNPNWFHSPYGTPADQWITWSGKPFSKGTMWSQQEFSYPFTTNSEGLVDREWSHQKKDSLRIVTMGDSFTQGVGAPVDSSWSVLLQNSMPHTEIVKGGVSGSDPLYEFMLFKYRLMSYHPDIVFVSMNSTDPYDVIIRGGFERFQPDGTVRYFRKAPWWQWWYGHSRFAFWIAYRILHIDNHTLIPEYRLPALKIQATHQIEQVVDSFQVLCKQQSIRCIFVFSPDKSELGNNKMDCDPIMRYARAKKYETVDLLKYFQSQGMNTSNMDLYHWKRDGHFNSRGYLLYAKGLQDYLMRN